MEKYIKKEIIYVEQYKPEIEDGFTCLPFVALCKWKDENGLYKQCHKCKLNIKKLPYFKYDDGLDILYENKILVKFENSDGFIIRNKDFLLDYENITRKEKLKKITNDK